MLDVIDPIESFRPDADSRCLCGKKKLFKNCCGSHASNRAPPFGVTIMCNYLPAAACDKLIKFVESKGAASDLAVYEATLSQAQSVEAAVNRDRVSAKIDLAEKQSVIDRWVGDIFHQFVAKRLKKKIRSFSLPDLMRYEKGGYYKPHADSDIFDKATGSWRKILDRDYSLLLYLNSDYEGGGLKFEYFNYSYKPAKGDLLIFPSDYLYLHEAQVVTDGVKYVIVSWASVK